jgi:hypothetical protein
MYQGPLSFSNAIPNEEEPPNFISNFLAGSVLDIQGH